MCVCVCVCGCIYNDVEYGSVYIQRTKNVSRFETTHTITNHVKGRSISEDYYTAPLHAGSLIWYILKVTAVCV